MIAQYRPDIARVAEETVLNLKGLENTIEVLRNDLAWLCQSIGHPEAARVALSHPRGVMGLPTLAGTVPNVGFAANLPYAGVPTGAPAFGVPNAFATFGSTFSPFAGAFANPTLTNPAFYGAFATPYGAVPISPQFR